MLAPRARAGVRGAGSAGAREVAASPCHVVPRGRDRVFREGDDCDTCYVVRSGHARACASTPTAADHARDFGPGDIFGELAMFDDERRSATVEAIDDARRARDPRADMRAADARTRRHRGQARDRARAPPARANERLARQSFQTVQSRVAAVLAQLVEQARAEGAGRARRAAHRHAGRGRAARRLLARVGQPLPRGARARGVISQGRGRLTVHDPAALERLCLLSRAPTSARLLRRRRGARRRVIVIVPARAPARARAAQGRRRRGRDAPRRPPRARCARRPASRSTSRERLGDVDYCYRRGGRRIHKTVHFYLCDFVAGDTADHDHEVDDARWMPLERGRRRAHLPGRARDDRARAVEAGANG